MDVIALNGNRIIVGFVENWMSVDGLPINYDDMTEIAIGFD